jgi:hypothetical protein
VAENTAQIDWISMDDKRASCRRLLADAAERVGIPNLAHWLDEDPSTLRNQLAHRERKRPSAELEDLVWLLDAEYRRLKAGVTGEVLTRPPDLTDGEALRLIHAKAQAGWDRRALAEIADILSRVGGTEDTWERRAVAAGWQPPGGHR